MTYALIALINFASSFLQASTGFGYAILAMFLMPMILPFEECSLISAAVIIAIALQMVISLRKHLNLKVILVPMIFCILTTWLGVYIIQISNEQTVRIIMGIFLILLSPYFYFTNKYHVELKNNFVNSVIVGCITGLATGMFNIVGPFLTIYYYNSCKDNLEFKANLEFSFLIAGIYSMVLNMIYTPITWELGGHMLFSCVAAVVAGVLGLKIYRKLDRKVIKYIIVFILPIMGIVLFLR